MLFLLISFQHKWGVHFFFLHHPQVVEDVRRVLADQQTLIQEKNEGDVLQNIVRDFWALLQELRQRSDLKTYFEEWQGTLTSVFSSGDFTQFFHQTGDMFTSMRDTEEFLSLSSELIDLMKIIIAESTEKVSLTPFSSYSLSPSFFFFSHPFSHLLTSYFY
jgi:hypothetical protein